MSDSQAAVRAGADDHARLARQVADDLTPSVAALAEAIRASLASGGKLLVFGNGGSAADAQHFAAELLGHSHADRRPLPAVALTTDSSTLTAIANDYSFDELFARQVSALARPGDVVVGISTSGESENVVRGLRAADDAGATTAALTGEGGRTASLADHVIAVPSRTTARIQEMHILIIHLICERIDDWAEGPKHR